MVLFSLFVTIYNLRYWCPKHQNYHKDADQIKNKSLKIKFFENFGQNLANIDKKCHFPRNNRQSSVTVRRNVMCDRPDSFSAGHSDRQVQYGILKNTRYLVTNKWEWKRTCTLFVGIYYRENTLIILQLLCNDLFHFQHNLVVK